jgi:ankyrin repeat protein
MSEPELFSLINDFSNAIEERDQLFINSLLAIGEVDANARLPRANNPPALVLAASLGLDDIVEFLLNAGARVDDVDNEGQSACHIAAMRGHVDVMRVLLTRRPNLKLTDIRGKSPLRVAIVTQFGLDKVGSIATMLLRAGASLDDVYPRDLCRFAATSTAAIQVLMDHNVDVCDLRGEFGQTPLHIAVGRHVDSCDFAVLSKLVDCGVDLEARSQDSESSTCSAFAIRADNADALRLFLMAGANANDVGRHGGLLLHNSVFSRSLKCTLLLLAAGADVAARDRLGRTACDLASAISHPKMMSFVHAMLASGASLDDVHENGKTPRLCLAESVDPEQVESARREIANARLDFVRYRALEVCIGLRSLGLDALQMCEILRCACGPLARVIAFHQWWKIATTVKHFQH